MSRSALSKQEALENQKLLLASQPTFAVPPPPSGPIALAIQPVAMPLPLPLPMQYAAPTGYYYASTNPLAVAQMSMPLMYQQASLQQYVPIPLTGESEYDNDSEEHRKNVIPIQGNASNFNMNNMLLNNITESEYFRALYQLQTYQDVIHEIGCSVYHVEPWQAGTSRIPSTAFCLLLKLLMMQLTTRQMRSVLESTKGTLVRAIGFLYLRYVCYNDLWNWYEKYLEDEEEASMCANGDKMTIGQFCTKLLTEMSYYGTTLPRIPVPIERKIKVMLLLLEEKKKRRSQNIRALNRGEVSVVAGSKVRAIYSDKDNEPAWYDAVIDSADEDQDNKFWVTFPEYGNSECVDIGDMDFGVSSNNTTSGGGGGSKGGAVGEISSRHRSRSDSRDRDRRHDSHRRRDSRSRSRDRGMDKTRVEPVSLMEKVLQSSREASAAVGKNYGQRPTSYKGSLSLKIDRYTVRQKSRSRSPDRSRSGHGREGRTDGGDAGGSSTSTSSSYQRERDEYSSRGSATGAVGDRGGYTRDESSGRQHRQQGSGGGGMMQAGGAISREQQARIKSLKERYGDASSR